MASRAISEAGVKCINKCCPKDDELRNLNSTVTKRLEGFAYLYMMIWTFIQLFTFVCLLIAFLFSQKNKFVKREDCCSADEILMRHNVDLPLEECSNTACMLYEFVFDGAREILQDRPRFPMDGSKSSVFEYDDQIWCCNLSGEGDQCCDKMPYGSSCGAMMWVSGFSAVCAMLMTQVINQGCYSFFARKNAFFVALGIPLVILVRLFVFFFLFYFFFGFMFLFIFFWIPMLYCDNPYGWSWWEFGYDYVVEWFRNVEFVITQGFTKWDGNMDFDTLIATHSSVAMLIDVVFVLIYIALSRIKDNNGHPYFNLTFFKL